MGLIRLCLAIAVVIAHSAPLFGMQWLNGRLSVEVFFIISGFYVTLILDRKYADNREGIYLFLSNRFLRIYPVYWYVIILTILINILNHMFPASIHAIDYIATWKKAGYLDGGLTILKIFSNLFIVGLDYGYFLRFDKNIWSLTSNYYLHPPYAYTLDLIPQAWTLSVEVFIYIIAPKLYRLSVPILLLVAFASFAMKGYALAHGFDYDPWTSRFILFEVGFFVLGSLMYRAFSKWAIFGNKTLGTLAIGVSIFGIIFFDFLPEIPFPNIGFRPKEAAFLLLIAACIPFAFARSQRWRTDRWIGELSYPAYLSFGIAVAMCNGSFGPFGVKPILLSLACAIFVVITLDAPLDRFRQARVRRSTYGRATSGIAAAPPAL